jgi:CofD-related protein of GAK system
MSVPTQGDKASTEPEDFQLARYARAPELGPRILFFTGGSALKETSRVLKRYTHRSIHVMTPFDSGGSSAELRRTMGMLSVGDMRNRMMALADESSLGNPHIRRLFSTRLQADASQETLIERLQAMVRGDDPLVRDVPKPMMRPIRTFLQVFLDRMASDFDLRQANLGNLILGGGYCQYEGDMDSVVALFSQLVEARGVVLPVVNADLHLKAHLEDGTTIAGQHNFTGKETAPLTSPIVKLRLIDGLDGQRPARIESHQKVRTLIETADLIVFPMGSFYSSVLCQLLPEGVGSSIVKARCPKVFVPNMGRDPEVVGTSIHELARQLTHAIKRDEPSAAVEDCLHSVLIDSKGGHYPHPLEKDAFEALGVKVVDEPMTSEDGVIDPQRLSELLLSMV